MIRAVLDRLAEPDDQGRDWYAWASTQMAHGFIGAALTGALIVLGMGAWLSAAVVALVYGGGKEVPDALRVPTWRTARDSLHDALFVTAGALLTAAVALDLGAVFCVAALAVAVGLAWGVAVRLAR